MLETSFLTKTKEEKEASDINTTDNSISVFDIVTWS